MTRVASLNSYIAYIAQKIVATAKVSSMKRICFDLCLHSELVVYIFAWHLIFYQASKVAAVCTELSVRCDKQVGS